MLSGSVNRQSLGAAIGSFRQNVEMEQWPERLKRLRKTTGLSQAKVAAALGIKPASVAQWELGRSRPDPDRFPLLARLYKTSVEELCGDDLPAVGQGDRLAILRLYDDLNDENRQDLLRYAQRSRRLQEADSKE